jgi:hypothetical protein
LPVAEARRGPLDEKLVDLLERAARPCPGHDRSPHRPRRRSPFVDT